MTVEIIICLLMLTDFAVGKPILNLTQFFIVTTLVCACYLCIYYKLWKIFDEQQKAYPTTWQKIKKTKI